MPACADDPPETAALPEAEWREPPGMLGFYVRRVKHYLRAQAEADRGHDAGCKSRMQTAPNAAQ